MMFNFNFFLSFIFIALFYSIDAGVINGCMPCQAHLGQKVNSARSALFSRDVYNPKITSPTHGTVWKTDSYVNVTWDIRDMPANTTNKRGRIVLGYLNDDNSNEHLDLDHPLAEDFDISESSRLVKVPRVNPANNYIVVLFGDSGNRSPTFTIDGN